VRRPSTLAALQVAVFEAIVSRIQVLVTFTPILIQAWALLKGLGQRQVM